MIKVWDVVNEAISDEGDEILRKSPWSVIIDPDFIEKAFEFAHEADPDAILRYNDYGLENPRKRKKLITLIKGLQEKKIPVSAIGTQAHLNVSVTYEIMDHSLSDLKTLGLPHSCHGTRCERSHGRPAKIRSGHRWQCLSHGRRTGGGGR